GIGGLEPFVEPELDARRRLGEGGPLGGHGFHQNGVRDRRSGTQQDGGQSRHHGPPHLIFSIATIATFGSTPFNVNRTASPTETDSWILGDTTRKPMVIAGM